LRRVWTSSFIKRTNMGFVKDILKKAREITGIKTLSIVVYNKEFNNVKDEEDILEKIIRNCDRLDSGKFISVGFQTENYHNILYFQMTEFPYCCGKAILSAITIYRNTSYYDERGALIPLVLSDIQVEGLVNLLFEFVDNTLERLGYSSYDFILSDIDNKILYEIVEGKKMFQSTATFKNRRNKYEHTCKNYTVNLRVIEEEKSKILIEPLFSR
jgi:hypothetical protein